MDNRERQNDSDPKQSSLMDGIDTLEELLPDELPEIPTNDPGTSRNNTTTTIGPLIPGSVTIIPQGGNEVDNFVSTVGSPKNAEVEMGRLEPQMTIPSHSNPIETPNPSSFQENEHPTSLTSFCRNPPPLAVSSFYQRQQASREIPSSNQIYLQCHFALPCHGEDMPSNEVSSSHRSQLPSVDASNFYPAQSSGNQNFDQAEPTSISFRETWDLIKATLFHQDQPSIENSSSHQWETLFCDPKGNPNFSDGITINYGQPPIGLSPQRSSCEYSISSMTLARQSCELRLQFDHPTVLTLQSEVDINGQVFCTSDNLERHSSTNADEKLFECSVCHKKFKHESSLKRHSHIHTGENKFECNKCDKKFLFNYLLEIHSRVHSGEKPYKCNTCGGEYAQHRHLKRHYMVHSGEKPYKCDTCGKEFTQYANLRRHYRVHSGEKPHVCDTCGGRFTSKYNLDAHYRTHTGEKPFKCNICDKAFSYKKSLKKHLASHSRKKQF